MQHDQARICRHEYQKTCTQAQAVYPRLQIWSVSGAYISQKAHCGRCFCKSWETPRLFLQTEAEFQQSSQGIRPFYATALVNICCSAASCTWSIQLSGCSQIPSTSKCITPVSPNQQKMMRSLSFRCRAVPACHAALSVLRR